MCVHTSIMIIYISHDNHAVLLCLRWSTCDIKPFTLLLKKFLKQFKYSISIKMYKRVQPFPNNAACYCSILLFLNVSPSIQGGYNIGDTTPSSHASLLAMVFLLTFEILVYSTAKHHSKSPTCNTYFHTVNLLKHACHI